MLRSQEPLRPSQLDSDNSSAFSQYQSPHTISEYIEQYRKANKPSPVLVNHPIKTHADGSVSAFPSSYPAQHLVDISWRSSLIVVVRIAEHKTFVLDDRSFLYTNFRTVIEDVLKDEGQKFIAGDELLVTRAGGEQTIDGMLVKAIDPEFAEFSNEATYLLFLNQVPGTNFYKAIAPRSFRIASNSNEEIRPMDAHPLRPPSEAGSSKAVQFLEEVREAIVTARQQEKSSRRKSRNKLRLS